MGHGQPLSGVARIKDVYGKARMYVTDKSKDYWSSVKSTNPRLNQTWSKVDEWCQQEQVDSRAYVEFCFSRCYPGYPMPSKFLLATFKNLYLSSGKPDLQYNQTKMKFELMSVRFSKRPQDEDILEYLLDPINAFDPIYIYTIAKQVGRQHELPPTILPRARKQAFCQPVYGDKFSHAIPKEVFLDGPDTIN